MYGTVLPLIVLLCCSNSLQDSGEQSPLFSLASVGKGSSRIDEESNHKSPGGGVADWHWRNNMKINIGSMNISLCSFLSCQNRCPSKYSPLNETTLSFNITNSISSSSNLSNPIVETCSCEDHCIHTGECCIDYFLKCHNISDPEQIVKILPSEVSNLDYPNFVSMTKIYGDYIYLGEYFTVVTSCPAGFSDVTVKYQCNDVNMTSPVSYVYNQVIIFRNVHCAICHGVEEINTVKWTPRLRCDGIKENTITANVLKAYREGKCHQVFDPPEKIEPQRQCAHSMLYSYCETVVPVNDVQRSPAECTREDKILCSIYKLPIVASRNQSLNKTFGANSFEHTSLSSTIVFDNPHCLKCRTGVTLEEITSCCDFTCHYTQDNAVGQGYGGYPDPAPLGIMALFDISEDGSGVEINGQLIPWSGFFCQVDEVYDHVSDTCRQLVCPSGYFLQDQECVRKDSLVDGDSQLLANGTQTIWLQFWLADNVSCLSILGRNILEIQTQLSTYIPGCGYGQSRTDSHLYDSIYQAILFSCSVDDLKLTMTINSHDNKSFADLYKTSLSIMRNYVLTYSDLFCKVSVTNKEQLSNTRLLCPDGRQLVEVNYANISNKDGKLYVVSTKDGFRQLYPIENILFDSSQIFQGCKMKYEKTREENTMANATEGNAIGQFQDLIPWVIINCLHENGEPNQQWPLSSYNLNVLLCEQPVSISSLRCPAIIYLKNQTQIENDTLTILGSDMIFKKEEYEILGDKVMVCSPFENLNDIWSKLKLHEFTPDQQYVMHILTAVSIFSLLSVLLVYFLIPDLRTLPGKITSCHVASLLIGHVTLSIDVPNKTFCRFLAAVSHFVWLSAFAWISALAVHMATSFFAPITNQKSRQEVSSVFCKYSLVCWGLPLVVVVISFAIDSVPSLNVKIEYGEDVCGWIGDAKAVICSFFVPVGISLLISLFAFLAAVFGIEKTTRTTRMATSTSRRSEGQRLFVYVKMAAALGFTWVLGLFVAFLQWSWLQWVYAVLNSLQGTLIALAFLVNKRVLRLLKQKLMRKTKAKMNSTLTSTTQTKALSLSTNSQHIPV